MRIAVFNADERMLILAEKLRHSHQVTVIDEDDTQKFLRKSAAFLDAAVLPAWGIEESGFIRMRTRSIYAAEFIEMLPDKCILFSGTDSAFFQHVHCRVKCWLHDETLLRSNAALTAEGLLCRMIETTDRSIFTYSVDIIGTGRCAKAAASLFKSLNIPFRFVTTSNGINSGGSAWISLEDWQKTSPYRLVVNTAPVCVITQQAIKNWNHVCYVYDLSSGAAGVDSKCIKHPFLKLFYEPALPARFAKESASDLVLNYIEKELIS